MISVTIHKPEPECITQAVWDDLVSRAQPNAFMSPAALQAAAGTGFADIHVLLAWDDAVRPRQLVGLWALRERRVMPLWPAVLDALPFEYAFLSSPVIDRARVVQVMPAFLEAIRSARGMPRVLSMSSLDAEATSFHAMRAALAVGQGACLELRSEQRPMLARDSVAKQSGERRKKIRQHWKKLGALGAAMVVDVTDPAAIHAAMDVFLQLELKSWKGAAGTALLCKEVDATFVRRLVDDLAAVGQISIQLLEVGGKPIAAQVLMFSGDIAFTWKTAYDASYAKFSPGVLLIDKMTGQLFETTAIRGLDSCSAEGSFMGDMWPDRRRMVDLLADVGPGTSLAFRLEAARLTARQQLKTWRDRLRTHLADSRARKAAESASPVGARPAGV